MNPRIFRQQILRDVRLLTLAVSVTGCGVAANATHTVGAQATGTGAWARVAAWPQLPANVVLGPVTDMAISFQGHVFVLHRANRTLNEQGLADTTTIDEPVVLVVDGQTGALLHAWGSAVFQLPHSISIDSKDNVWITDVGRQAKSP